MRYFTWSNPSIKNIAAQRRELMKLGKVAFKSDTVSHEFDEHLYGERKARLPVKNGPDAWRWVQIGSRPNHLWDCWCMSITAAGMVGILSNPLESEA